MRNVLIVDIETQPSEDAEIALQPFFKQLRGKYTSNAIAQAREINEKKEKLLNKAMLTPVASKLLCIGILKLDYNDNSDIPFDEDWSILFNYNVTTEKDVLRWFSDSINIPNLKFVTFNGRSFDFPFLMFRAAVHGIDLSLPIYPYNGKDNHYDLFVHLNQISNLGNIENQLSMIGLGKWLEYFGLRKKPSIASGEINLVQLIKDGKLAEIEEYVKGDIYNTYDLWKRFGGNFMKWERIFGN